MCIRDSYCGVNALSGNMITVDRKLLKNPNGVILGTPGAGKSFATKREMFSVYLLTNDDIIICDPEAKYWPLVKRLHLSLIHIYFEHVARKYGVDFAIKKDKSADKPRYLVFFKAVSYTHLMLCVQGC